MSRATWIHLTKVSLVVAGAAAALAGVHALLPSTAWWARWLFLAAIVAVAVGLLREPAFKGWLADEASSYKGVRLPAGVMLTPGHGWVRPLDRHQLVLGADDLALRLLGEPERIGLPKRGRVVREGDTLFTLERSGRAVELRSPVDGTVLDVNDGLARGPALMAREPYEAGWAVKLLMSDSLADGGRLLRGQAARDWFRAEVDRLLGAVAGGTMADGGVLVADFHMHLDDELFGRVREDFLGSALDSWSWPRLGLRHLGGERVGRGIYWSIGDGTALELERCDVLPGDATRVYWRLSPLALLAAPPVAGFAVRLLLPVVGLAMIAGLGVEAVVTHGRRLVNWLGTRG